MQLYTAKVRGQLTVADWGKILDDLSSDLRRGDTAFLLDILDMTGYDPAVRDQYIRWHKANGGKLKRTAVVTNKTMWRLVISTISVATGGGTRAFEQVDEAQRWLLG